MKNLQWRAGVPAGERYPIIALQRQVTAGQAGQVRKAGSKHKGQRAKAVNQLRIIGGQWRGRRLQFPDAPGLRPTGDRIRETLFNWLAPHIAGSCCLDLFAGSGALGLEALSRGAARCDFVESQSFVARALQEHLRSLDGTRAGRVFCQQAHAFLGDPPPGGDAPYDIVFLDPPFAAGLLESACRTLEESGLLGASALVYLEHGPGKAPALPQRWSVLRDKRAGDVSYALLTTA